MRPFTLLLALSGLMASGCSTTPQPVPAKIDPPPVGLTLPCQAPADLAADATAQDLAEWTVAWIGAYGCERGKRAALVEAWPK